MKEKTIPYWQQLQSPQWQKKRLKILERAEFKCECCADETQKLDVHHRFYKKGLMAWEYPDSSLVAVCETCHEELANNERCLLMSIDPRDIISIISLAHNIRYMREYGIGLKSLVDASHKIMQEEIKPEDLQ